MHSYILFYRAQKSLVKTWNRRFWHARSTRRHTITLNAISSEQWTHIVICHFDEFHKRLYFAFNPATFIFSFFEEFLIVAVAERLHEAASTAINNENLLNGTKTRWIYDSLVCWCSQLINWQRPRHSNAKNAAGNFIVWRVKGSFVWLWSSTEAV